MKPIIVLIALSLIPIAATTGITEKRATTEAAQDAQVDLGISVADGELRNFYLAVSNHYRVPGEEVVAVKERYRFRNEELPVVYYLAARARVKPSVIIDLRISQMSWLDISFHYGLTPEIFFVPLTMKKVGPPYGKAYGYYKKYHPRKDWKKIVLSDSEIVDLVNLRFISEYHKLSPDSVVQMRSQGMNFVSINGKIEKGKGRSKGNKGKAKRTKKDKKTKKTIKKTSRKTSQDITKD
jgi:hypothetical protein